MASIVVVGDDVGASSANRMSLTTLRPPPLTQRLRDTLILSRSRLDEWVEHEKAKVDVLVARHHHQYQQQQNEINHLVGEWLALKMECGLSIRSETTTTTTATSPNVLSPITNSEDNSGENKSCHTVWERKKHQLQREKDDLDREIEMVRNLITEENAKHQGTI
jgi:hypothetical protein